jgi:D-3-phosphoglycerate dehydrogenase
VVTPHLGASTSEAQEKAGVSVAKSVRLALAGELVPDAVNVAGGIIHEDVRPGIPLAEKLGRILTALSIGDSLTVVELEVAGEIADKDVKSLQLAALKGVFTDVVSDHVSYVNAPVLAEQRGVETRLTTTSESPAYRNTVTVKGATSNGTQLSVSGTLTGPKQVQKVVGIDGYEIEVPLAEHLLVFRYTDRPGVIGTIGNVLGDADVNIAGMDVSRQSEGGEALAMLTLDAALPAGVAEQLGESIGASRVAGIDLLDLEH